MIAPKMATEMPAAMIVSMPVPSQTIKKEERARISGDCLKRRETAPKFQTTGGCTIKSVAAERLTRATRKTDDRFSQRDTDMGKQGTLGYHADKAGDDTGRTGEKKLSMIWKSANNSQTVRKKKQHKKSGQSGRNDDGVCGQAGKAAGRTVFGQLFSLDSSSQI